MLVVASSGMRLIGISTISLLSSVSSCLTDLHASCMACIKKVAWPVRWMVQRCVSAKTLAAGTLHILCVSCRSSIRQVRHQAYGWIKANVSAD